MVTPPGISHAQVRFAAHQHQHNGHVFITIRRPVHQLLQTLASKPMPRHFGRIGEHRVTGPERLIRPGPARIAECGQPAHFFGQRVGHRLQRVGELRIQVVAPALDAALELAAKVTANGPVAVRVSKQVINESPDWSYADRWNKQAELMPQVFMSEDAREGSLAFAEKRAPNWKGK